VKEDIMLKLKRVYETPDVNDGIRFLVERLWPRGMKKEDLEMDAWLKEVAMTSTNGRNSKEDIGQN